MGVGLWFIAPQSSLPKGPSGPLLMVFDTKKGPKVQEQGAPGPFGLDTTGRLVQRVSEANTLC